MSHRRGRGRFLYTMFIGLFLCVALSFFGGQSTTVFIALWMLGWHALANAYCAAIASYRFVKPTAKYVEIKNKVIRKILVRPFYYGEVASASQHDDRTNVIGLVLHMVNTVMLAFFEILLFMPKLPCATYVFSVGIPEGRIGWDFVKLELDSLNEVIPAEASRAFALLLTPLFFVFYVLFERSIKKHRRRLKRTKQPQSPYKPFIKTEWRYPLYTALVDISVRRNNKKHKFWYKVDQIQQIEHLVTSLGNRTELNLQKREIHSFLLRLLIPSMTT